MPRVAGNIGMHVFMAGWRFRRCASPIAAALWTEKKKTLLFIIFVSLGILGKEQTAQDQTTGEETHLSEVCMDSAFP